MRPDDKCRLPDAVTRFNRETFSYRDRFTCIGLGSLGAKAGGLANIKELLEIQIAPSFKPAIQIGIPFLTVIATEFFDIFLELNDLFAVTSSTFSDEQVIDVFQEAQLPAQLVADLRAFVAKIQTPLAIRSSSLLEDAMREPFAGVYATKMIPNNQSDLEARLWALTSAVKYVYASAFLKKAQDYLRASGHSLGDEKMAVIIQEVVGACHNARFYPDISGVARSFNFYPLGLARPDDGVVALALGLGKAIVEDGIAWHFSPAYPQANPPYGASRDLLKMTQKYFWAIDMRVAEENRVTGEIEHLEKHPLADAEQDGTLSSIASTYKAEDEKIVIGIGDSGPRILDFAPILKANLAPLPELLKELLKCCGESLGTMVDIEFAVTLSHPSVFPIRFGFLQVRPMVASYSPVEVRIEELSRRDVLVATKSALGNGILSICDVVHVKPKTFEAKHSHRIGLELETINRKLVNDKAQYVLIGIGRWGSSDPSAGIPVNFGQISGARAIVETTSPGIDFILSQGTHFFHNVTSLRVLYFSVSHTGNYSVDWEWLERQPIIDETEFIRHVRLPSPLSIRVDGRTSQGVILKRA